MHIIRSAIVALALALAAGAAFAHSKMMQSTPANGAAVAAGLSAIKLQFAKPVRLTLVNIVRADDASEVKSTTPIADAFIEAQEFAVPPLAAGKYDIAWVAVAKDGHVMKGTISFQVKD